MTDKDKLTALLDEWGVPYDPSPESEWIPSSTVQCVQLEPEYSADESEAKVVGYNGFITRFRFDVDGKFLNVGIWELGPDYEWHEEEAWPACCRPARHWDSCRRADRLGRR